ncbi:MAG TPA: hypothetical protein VG347_05110 [Verrucomicrobiae bacterium]|nr:hypothetical protein [Verrucomicrobiae bacterium]
MSEPMYIVEGWTVIRGKRDMKRFEKENHISYRSEPLQGFPCLARMQLSSDENAATYILEKQELIQMLAAIL